jgi:hypothetical protein
MTPKAKETRMTPHKRKEMQVFCPTVDPGRVEQITLIWEKGYFE